MICSCDDLLVLLGISLILGVYSSSMYSEYGKKIITELTMLIMVAGMKSLERRLRL